MSDEPKPMLTVAEFRAAAEGWRRHVNRETLIAMGWFLVAGAFFVLFESTIQSWATDVCGNPEEGPVLALAVFFAVALIPVIVLVVRLSLWHRRESRLKCSHCQKGLFVVAHRSIASRLCPFCKSPVLQNPADDADAPPAPKELPRAEEWQAVVDRHARRKRLWLLPAGVVCLLGWWAVGRESYRHQVCLWTLDASGDAEMSIVLAMLVFFVLPIVPVLLVMGYVGLRARLDSRLRCGYCRTRLDRHRSIVLDTGNCASCGRQVLQKPLEKIA